MTKRNQMNAAWRVPYLRLMSNQTRECYARDLIESAYDSETSIKHAAEVVNQLTKNTSLMFTTEYEFKDGCWQFIQ